MLNEAFSLPANEADRLLELSSYDLDYSDMKDRFSDLTRLAAKIAGVPISLINLIDSYTQWTIADFGLDIEQMPREKSVCQYTISGDFSFRGKGPYKRSPF